MKNFTDCLAKWNHWVKIMYTQCVQVGANICMPIYYEELVLRPDRVVKRLFKFLNIPFNNAVLHHENYVGDKVLLSKYEASTNQVKQAINFDGLNTWLGKIPAHVLDKVDGIAPMLTFFGYETKSKNKTNYHKLNGDNFQQN